MTSADRAIPGGKGMAQGGSVRGRRLRLTLVLAGVALGVVLAALAVAYRTTFAMARDDLQGEVASEASLIEGLLRLERDPEAVLDLLRQTQGAGVAGGETREFTIARLEDGRGVFLLRRRASSIDLPTEVPVDEGLAEPMHRALSGRSGWMIGLDYRGVEVLAAYRTVASTGWGLVAKMDVAEVFAPFWRLALVTGGLAVLLVLLGIGVFLRTSEPLIREVEAAEERWQFALEGSGQGVWDWDAGTGHLFCSEGWRRLLDVTEAELTGTYSDWATRVHPEDLARVSAALQRHLDGVEPVYTAEYRIRRSDGVWLWALDRGKVVARDDSGKPTRVVGALTDLTAHKETEDRLKEALQDVEKVNERASYLNRVLRALGRVNHLIVRERKPDLLVQRACEVLTETGAFRTAWIVADDREGRARVLGKAGFDETFAPFAAAVRGGGLPSCTSVARAAKGVPVLVDRAIVCRECLLYRSTEPGTTVAVALENGGVTHGYLRATPATLEPPSESAIAILEEVANDIAFALHHIALEGQLLHAQRMEAVGRLAGGVAHDFNNLLTVILTCASFAADELAADHPASADLAEIQAAGERAASLVRQLLAFSRKQVRRPTLVDLSGVVRGLKPMLRRLLNEDVDLRLELTEAGWPVLADTGQLEQVLMNLVVNSRDAMPTGGCITIATRNVTLGEDAPRDGRQVEPGRYVTLLVSDTGTGMDESTRGHLFEPFFTTKALGEGTGLGLATVHGIVHQSGGHIEVESELGVGTTFTLYFPMTTQSSPGAYVVPNDAHEAPRGDETILLVEDEDAVRQLAQRVLMAQGYTVLVAPDGLAAEALARNHQGPLHLLLTDVAMPEMSGVETATRLRVRFPDLRVLYMSGYADHTLEHQRALDPTVEVVEKPFSQLTLAYRVRELLDR